MRMRAGTIIVNYSDIEVIEHQKEDLKNMKERMKEK